MPRTTLTAVTPVGPYPALPVTALALDLTWTAADITNFNQFMFSGPKLLLARNVHAATPYTVTVTSIMDSKRRTGDITTYALAAGKAMALLINNSEGWMQADGFVYIAGSNASVEFCVITL